MKSDLLHLINQIDGIKTYFHIVGGSGIPRVNTIYDTPAFSAWKQEVQLELQDVFDRTKDKFIWDTLVNLKQGFNGWKDETAFNELSGSLYAICKKIDKYYYSSEITEVKKIKGEITMLQKSPKIFISHASSDKEYVSKLIDLLEGIGLNENHMFCSSIVGYGVSINQDIYDYIKLQFETHNLHVIFVLSENYYKSVACLNEMGAAWILHNRYTSILLPGFEFKDIKGAINPRQIGLKLDNDLIDVKEKLGQLKDCLLNEFGLPTVSDIRWEQKRDTFINSITPKGIKTELSESAHTFLQTTYTKYTNPYTNKKMNILVIPYTKDLHKIPKVNDMVPIHNEILGNIKLSQIESFALLQGSKNDGGVKIKYLVKGIIEKNSSNYKNYDYLVNVIEVNLIDEVAITSAIDNKNTLFSLDELLNLSK